MANNYQETIEAVKSTLLQDLSGVKTTKDLEQMDIKYLGRQGEVNQLFKTLPIKDDPEIGKSINSLKNYFIGGSKCNQ